MKGKQFDDYFGNPYKGWNIFNSPARLPRHEQSTHHNYVSASVLFINTKNRLMANQDVFSQQSRASDRLSKETKEAD